MTRFTEKRLRALHGKEVILISPNPAAEPIRGKLYASGDGWMVNSIYGIAKFQTQDVHSIHNIKIRLSDMTKRQQVLAELCSRYILGIINYDQLIFRGTKLGYSEAEIRSKADDPDW